MASSKAGEANTDQTDQYPTEIQGLVHVKGILTAFETSRIRGVLISESGVTVENALEVIHEPSLYTNPPEGYTVFKGMKVSQGTWRQVVD